MLGGAFSMQIMRVRAPWVKACHMIDNRFYAIPNFDVLILGGTAYQDDWNAEVSEQVWLVAQQRMRRLLTDMCPISMSPCSGERHHCRVFRRYRTAVISTTLYRLQDSSDIWEGCCAHLPSLRQCVSFTRPNVRVDSQQSTAPPDP